MFNNIFNYDWIRSVDLWFWKHLTYQLSHNHCPALKFMATPVRQKSFSVLIMVRATFEMAFGLEQDVEECLPAWTWTKWKVFWTYTVKRASLLSIDFIVFCSFEAVHFNLTRGQHLLFTLYSIGRSGGGERAKDRGINCLFFNIKPSQRKSLSYGRQFFIFIDRCLCSNWKISKAVGFFVWQFQTSSLLRVKPSLNQITKVF